MAWPTQKIPDENETHFLKEKYVLHMYINYLGDPISQFLYIQFFEKRVTFSSIWGYFMPEGVILAWVCQCYPCAMKQNVFLNFWVQSC